MAILDDIATERQRVTDRLARIDAERARLAEQLSELEATERVVSRFGSPRPASPRRGRRGVKEAAAAPTSPTDGRRARAATSAASARKRQQRRSGRRAAVRKPELSLGDATLRAVEALGTEASAQNVRDYLAKELRMQVRSNHLGMALQRHRRAGRLEQRGEHWSIPGHQTGESVSVN